MVIKQTLPLHGQFDKTRDPGEVELQFLLSRLPCDHSNILELRHYRGFPAAETHRLYLEYAPHGDLFTLGIRYRRWRRYFPEPFLWHLFHELSKATLLLQKGNLPADEEAAPPIDYDRWTVRGIKPELNNRGIRFRGNLRKAGLVALLREDDLAIAERKRKEEAKKPKAETPIRAHWKEIGESA